MNVRISGPDMNRKYSLVEVRRRPRSVPRPVTICCYFTAASNSGVICSTAQSRLIGPAAVVTA